MNTPLLPKINILGIDVAAVTLQDTIGLIESWITNADFGHYVCATGVHGITEGMRNPAIQEIHNKADAVVPDGMPLVWFGRKRGYHSMNRVYGPDLMLAVLQRATETGWTNYFYGGAPGVAEALKVAMEQKFKGLKVIGTFCPPFRPLNADEETSLLEEIKHLQPDLLWIGLSTPKQELLMAHLKTMDIKAKVMLGVGAAFDFHTGRIRQAPRWIQQCGLEWLFRLCMEPRRLGPRYLRNNPLFVWALLCEALGFKRKPISPS